MIVSKFSSLFTKAIGRILPTPHRYEDLEKLIRCFDSSTRMAEVLYLGDSVVERVSDQDEDKRTLDQMLAASLRKNKRLTCISHSAYHMKVYLGLVSALKRMLHKPEAVILPVNLRSFSPQWDLEPSWQFESEIQCLREYANGGARILKNNEHDMDQAYEEFDAVEVEYPSSHFDRVGQFRLVVGAKPVTEVQRFYRSKQLFIFHYMHPLRADHPKIKALVEVLDALLSMNIRVLIYVTPVNHEAGIRFVSDAFQRQLHENTSIVAKSVAPYLQTGCVKFEDYGCFLGERYFFNVNNPTEHLNQEGRMALVSKLTDSLLHWVDGFENRES